MTVWEERCFNEEFTLLYAKKQKDFQTTFKIPFKWSTDSINHLKHQDIFYKSIPVVNRFQMLQTACIGKVIKERLS